jgi:hypothetical protein
MQHVTMHKPKKAWFKRVWVWIGIIVLIGIVVSATSPKDPATPATTAPTAETPKEEKSATWDIEAVYTKINNGMTKAEVEAATGKTGDTCTESTNEYTGKTEFCNYGNAFIDKGTITVTYSQDVVSGKTKSKY